VLHATVTIGISNQFQKASEAGMGDLIGNAVAGTLYYAPPSEFERVRRIEADPARTTALFADLCRLNVLYMVARAGSGHLGSCFSSLDIVAWLLLREMRDGKDGQDVFFSSKGHDAPGHYAALMATGRLPFDLIHRLRRLDGLPGHPDVGTVGIVTNTGSLGMGISKAKGMAMANRLSGRRGRVFVMTGDGELQEGQIWESLIGAANRGLDEIVVIIDHNKLQSDTLVERTSSLGDLDAKFASFGWHVQRVDGHDLAAFASALERCATIRGKPHVIIADTVKGCGISFMEHTAFDSDVELYKFHSGAPSERDYVAGVQELIDRINDRFRTLGQTELLLETDEAPVRPAPKAPQRLIPAYGEALTRIAATDERIVALDADLVLDTGLIPFRDRFPDRFIECGIAEMDMVSQAGGLALSGRLPIVHSFACFLSTRPNEQIYNNATERTKIVYVGSLAGLLPGGPGHSHQCVRDIAALGGIPGLVMVEPATPAEVEPLLRWCIEAHNASSYMRLVSIPVELEFATPEPFRPVLGQGVSVRSGGDAILFSYGPVMLNEAVKAARLLEKHGIALEVVNMPWLNRVDEGWLRTVIGAHRAVFTLDNHYTAGGQGETIAAAVAALGLGVPVHRFGLTEIPVSGTNDEVLRRHRLDAESLADAMLARMKVLGKPA
jgi:transketolase